MRSLLFNLFFYGFTAVMALIAWPVARFGSRARLQRLIGLWGRTVRRALEVILRARVELHGLGNLPGGGTWLLVCKHQSELDAVMLACMLPHAGAVAMRELERYPLFGPVLRRLGFVLVSVSGPRQSMTAEVIRGAQRIFAEGRPMVIFPEAALMSLGARERYRKGIGHIYANCDVPVVPVASCLGVIWPRREWVKHAHQTAAIEVLEPIPPGLQIDRFMALIEERIETATMRLIREHAKGAVLAAAEDRHARGVANED